VIFASGHSSFGRCVTKVGWSSVGSIFFEKISLVISNSSQAGLDAQAELLRPGGSLVRLAALEPAGLIARRLAIRSL
jgi:hypothetical protein